MSGTSTPRPAKSMSSRLLTMKFMQRAAAASPTASLSAPSTPDGELLRHRKQGDESPLFDVNEMANHAKIRAAMEEEAAKQQILMDKVAAEAGETRWVLNFEESDNGARSGETPIKVVQLGFADLDRDLKGRAVQPIDEENAERPALAGRRSFGKFNRIIEKLHDPNAESSSESDSDSEKGSDEDPHASDDSEDEDGTRAMLKEERAAASQRFKDERKKKKRAEKKELVRLAELRKKKDVKLNGLTSISNSGPANGKGSPGGKPDKSRLTCNNCGEVGHFGYECPRSNASKRGHNDRDEPKAKKSRKSY